MKKTYSEFKINNDLYENKIKETNLITESLIDKNLNFHNKIKSNQYYLKTIITKGFGKNLQFQKPLSLIKFEEGLKKSFFGEKGKLLSFVPSLEKKYQLKNIMSERNMTEKIELGGMPYLYYLEDKNLNESKKKCIEAAKELLFNSNNFSLYKDDIKKEKKRKNFFMGNRQKIISIDKLSKEASSLGTLSENESVLKNRSNINSYNNSTTTASNNKKCYTLKSIKAKNFGNRDNFKTIEVKKSKRNYNILSETESTLINTSSKPNLILPYNLSHNNIKNKFNKYINNNTVYFNNSLSDEKRKKYSNKDLSENNEKKLNTLDEENKIKDDLSNLMTSLNESKKSLKVLKKSSSSKIKCIINKINKETKKIEEIKNPCDNSLLNEFEKCRNKKNKKLKHKLKFQNSKEKLNNFKFFNEPYRVYRLNNKLEGQDKSLKTLLYNNDDIDKKIYKLKKIINKFK